jgi:nitrite reductase/ring-hydroxylating ferredoxin subunit
VPVLGAAAVGAAPAASGWAAGSALAAPTARRREGQDEGLRLLETAFVEGVPGCFGDFGGAMARASSTHWTSAMLSERRRLPRLQAARLGAVPGVCFAAPERAPDVPAAAPTPPMCPARAFERAPSPLAQPSAALPHGTAGLAMPRRAACARLGSLLLGALPLGALAWGQSLVYQTPAGTELAITRHGRGTSVRDFGALSNVCPHLGCRVRWDLGAGAYLCPCHDGRFDAAGRPTAGPPLREGTPLGGFPLEIEHELLFVVLPAHELRAASELRAAPALHGRGARPDRSETLQGDGPAPSEVRR